MNCTRYGTCEPVRSESRVPDGGLALAHDPKWGLFGYHFLGKNLGVALTSLPWLPAEGRGGARSARRSRSTSTASRSGSRRRSTSGSSGPSASTAQPDRKWLYVVVALSAALPAAMDLLYQNSGWRQFGYRFSNDYAVLLFVLLAVGARPMRRALRGVRGLGRRLERLRRGHVRQGRSSTASTSGTARRPSSTSRTDADEDVDGLLSVARSWPRCGSAAARPLSPPGTAMETLTVTSRSFPSSGQIPVDYTCDGANRSPAITWSAPPPGTQSFAIVVEDPDAPSGTFTHWIVSRRRRPTRARSRGSRPSPPSAERRGSTTSSARGTAARARRSSSSITTTSASSR